MDEKQIIFTCILGGPILMCLWWAACFLSWCASWVCCWMDDFESSKPKPVLLDLAMKLLGYKESKNEWYRDKYIKNGKEKDSDYALFLISFLLLPVPPLVIFWQGGSAVLSIVFIAFSMRMIKRHKKLFDSHLKDKKAHK